MGLDISSSASGSKVTLEPYSIPSGMNGRLREEVSVGSMT